MNLFHAAQNKSIESVLRRLLYSHCDLLELLEVGTIDLKSGQKHNAQYYKGN